LSFVLGYSKFAYSLGIAAGQKLVAVYGRQLINPGPYGKHKYVLCPG
jgi:hypothetical protein